MLNGVEIMKITDEDQFLTVWNHNSDVRNTNSKFRGCITDKENKIICPSLGYTLEYNIKNKDNCVDHLTNMSEWKWYYSMEGTMLRLYNYQNKWRLSTHKKLSAFKSRWSCNLTFGEMFVDALRSIFHDRENVYEWFVNQLDKNNIYYFFLRSNSQNRVICHTNFIKDHEKLVFFGHRDCKSFQFHFGKDLPMVIENISKPIMLTHTFQTIDEIFEYAENKTDPFMYQGISGYCESNGECKIVKILNTKYKELIKIRGNNHNLKFRYLELRCDPERKEKLYMLYPKLVQIFEDYEKLIQKISKRISKTYTERFIDKKYITLPKEEFLILRKCHLWCKMNNETYITCKNVENLINNESPLYIYKMINRFRSSDQTYHPRFSLNFKKKESNFDSIHDFYNCDSVSSDETIV